MKFLLRQIARFCNFPVCDDCGAVDWHESGYHGGWRIRGEALGTRGVWHDVLCPACATRLE